MALELRGGLLLRRRIPQPPPLHHPNKQQPHHSPRDRHVILPRPRTRPRAAYIPLRRLRPRQGPQQAVTRRPLRLVLPSPPPLLLPGGVPGAGDARQEEGRRRAHGPEVPALRVREDAPVEDGAHGPKDTVQCLRREVQIGPARAGVPAGGEPNVRVGEALEFAPEGDGAEEAEGVFITVAAASAAVCQSRLHFRRIQRW